MEYNYLYIYIYIYYIRFQKYLTAPSCGFLCGIHTKKPQEGDGCDLEHKARAIRSGETPQKSLILPPVHTFSKESVAPLNLIFS